MMQESKRCSKCAMELPLAQFDRQQNGRWGSYCKSCLSLYCRHHYVKNAAAHNARRAVARRRYRIRNQAYVLSYLLSHPCIDCGEADPIVLEFDHVDRGSKQFEVSNLSARGRSLADLEREIKRCVVRCARCHRRRTARQFAWAKGISLFPGCSSVW